MKVLHVINKLSVGGAEKLFVDLVVGMQNITEFQNDVLVLEWLDSILLQKLQDNFHGEIICLSANSSMYNPFSLFKLIGIIKKYDVVHAHLFPSSYWIVIAKFIYHLNVKIFVTEHSTVNRRMKYKIGSLADKFIYGNCNGVVCVSEDVCNSISKHLKSNFIRRKLCVIENGINPSDYSNISSIDLFKSLGVDSSSKFVLMTARFIYPKDQMTVIKAISLLPENIHCVFLGDGETKENCCNYVTSNNLSHRVHFMGQRLDVPAITKSCHISVLSSYWEGLSLSTIESIASKRPILVSDVPGLNNIIDNIEYRFKVEDYEELAKKILHLLTNQNDYDIAIETQHNVLKRFILSEKIERYAELYRQG